MMYNNQEEIWFQLNNNGRQGTTVIAISNCGRMRLKNGNIREIPLRMKVYHNGGRIYCYRIILEQFKPKNSEDEKLGRDVVDHITHKPVGICLNDVRNLRWCSHKENCNFAEARHNFSIARKGNQNHKGHKHSDETKKKLSLAMKGKSSPNKGKHYKIIEGKRAYYN